MGTFLVYREILGPSGDLSCRRMKNTALGKSVEFSGSQCLHLDSDNHGLDRDG